LTHSGRLTHKVVTRQPWIRRRSGKVRRLQTDILTTEPRRQSVTLKQDILTPVGEISGILLNVSKFHGKVVKN